MLLLALGLSGGAYLYLTRAPEAPPADDCRFVSALVPEDTQGDVARSGSPSEAVEPVEGLAPLAVPVSRRFGFGLSTSAAPERWAQALGAGWYINWSTSGLSGDQALEYWPMVRVAPGCTRPTPEEAGRLAAQYPGRTWIIGNEPDVASQDNLTPEQYAEAYHAFHDAIRTADPQARLAVAGISAPTPLRMAYLDRVLESYRGAHGAPMPVDVWTVHNFVLREERSTWGTGIPPGFDEVQTGRLTEVADHGRLDLFEQQLRDFRRWMAERGYRDTPLALTEYGILMPSEYGFPPEAVAQYLDDTATLLLQLRDPETGYPADDNRLVQRWAWFSLADTTFPTGDLADLGKSRLTEAGRAYRRAVERWADAP